MLKRELKFSTYLLPLMMVSFFPLMSHADFTPDQLKALLASGINVTASADGKTFTLTTAPVAAPIAAANANAQPNPPAVAQPAAPAPEIPGMLDAADLAAAGVSVSIKASGNTATLEGWVAPDCAQDIEVATTGPDYPLLYSETNGVKSVGFAIHNKTGHFLACMKKPQNNCAILKGCVSLSSIPGTTPYQIDGQDHISLAYINAKSGTPQAVKVNVVGQYEARSQDEIDAANKATQQANAAAFETKRKAIEKANVTSLTDCVKKAGNADDLAAIKLLITPDHLNDSDGKTIGDLISKKEIALEKSEIKSVTDKIKDLLTASKSSSGGLVKRKGKSKKDEDDDDISNDDVADRIGKLEDKVYDYAAQLDQLKEDGKMEDKDYTKQQDVLATVVLNLIKLKVSDDPSPESFDNARDMLARAVGDSDDDDSEGLHPSNKVAKILEATDPVLVRAKIASEVKTCMEEQRGLASYDKSDCSDANSDYESLYKKLDKEDKACAKMKKMDKDEKADCKETSKELEALSEVPGYEANDVTNEYNTAVANLQKSRGVGAQGQAQQQNPLLNQLGLQNGQFSGSPTVMNFANGGIQVPGVANGLGYNQFASPYQQAAVTYPQIGISPYQQNNLFNGYLGH